MLRALLCMLQGTWFWGVGQILYPPLPGAKEWDAEDHHSLMLAVICFSGHVAANIVIFLIVGVIVGCCHRRKDVRYSALPLKALGEEVEGEGDCCLPQPESRRAAVLEFHDEVKVNGADTKHPDSGALLHGGDDDSDMEFQAAVRK
jgi:hypothetical protein